MPIIKSKFKTNKVLHNGHLQTMYPYFFRKVSDVAYKRQRLELDDGDFLDLDVAEVNSDELLILTHGLEGSSDAAYIKGMVKYYNNHEHKDVIAWNMRSCSGELNRKESFYHGAQIEDLHEVIEFSLHYKRYKKISLMGFSLGGNLTAFYLATMGIRIPAEVSSAVIFSAPFDLKSCILKLQGTPFGHIYAQNFLMTMKSKVFQKHEINMLQDLDMESIKRAHNFLDFDNLVTAPLAGFKSADQYYAYASSANIIHKIQIPTLIVQAQNDPFLAKTSFPIAAARTNKNIFLEITPSGGHIGFFNFNHKMKFWAEKRSADFIKKVG